MYPTSIFEKSVMFAKTHFLHSSHIGDLDASFSPSMNLSIFSDFIP